jgi:hypothetical protein
MADPVPCALVIDGVVHTFDLDDPDTDSLALSTTDPDGTRLFWRFCSVEHLNEWRRQNLH